MARHILQFNIQMRDEDFDKEIKKIIKHFEPDDEFIILSGAFNYLGCITKEHGFQPIIKKHEIQENAQNKPTCPVRLDLLIEMLDTGKITRNDFRNLISLRNSP